MSELLEQRLNLAEKSTQLFIAVHRQKEIWIKVGETAAEESNEAVFNRAFQVLTILNTVRD